MPSVPPIRIRAPAIVSALSNSKGCTHIYLDPTTYIPVVNTLAQVATTAGPLSPVLVRKDRSLVFWQYEHHSIAQDVAETYHKLRHYARTYDCDKVTPRSATSPYTLFIGEEYAASSNTRAARRQPRDVATLPGAGYIHGIAPVHNTLPVTVASEPPRGKKRQCGQPSISTANAPAAPPLANRGVLPLPRRSAFSPTRLHIKTTHSLAETVMSSHVGTLSVPHATSSGPPMVEQNSETTRYGIGYSSNNTTSVSSSVSAQHITRFDDETVAVDDIDDGSLHRTKRSRTSASMTPFSTSFRSAKLPPTSPTSTSPPSIPSGAGQPALRPDKGKQRAMPREDESSTSSLSPSLRRKPQHVQPSRGRKRKTRHDDDADTSGPSHKRIAVSLSYTESSASPTPSQESAASPAASQGSAASSTSSQGSIVDDLITSERDSGNSDWIYSEREESQISTLHSQYFKYYLHCVFPLLISLAQRVHVEVAQIAYRRNMTKDQRLTDAKKKVIVDSGLKATCDDSDTVGPSQAGSSFPQLSRLGLACVRLLVLDHLD
ncbi:hypothetical protein IEO21_08605 [Rhodonia placenta]|uniref:Uncharacterized protein n=1 Tax=Rhodonia placenta TaxID=104341 RepID=A0A8H7TZ82_9APHY|nr:hypothetical protein IEO21_08605 [Postia placenta]